MPNPIGKTKLVSISKETKKSYLDYAMSVIVARALPDVRDGLKPVHRRILFAMQQMGILGRTNFSKSAKVVGEVLGKYHPHGDASIYEALVRLAQNFSMRYPLLQGQGNFGSIDGDSAAAMRYTEVRLAKISQEMLSDLDKETIPFTANFDTTLQEPQYLPALLPNLLLMGAEGIAVGMATKIPPHNLTEVCQAAIAMIKRGKLLNNKPLKEKLLINQLLNSKPKKIKQYIPVFDSDISLEEILNYIKGPDFPTAGAIYGREEIKNTYQSGRGKILIRGKAEIEETKKNRFVIIIRELPYQVNKAQLVATIAQLAREQKIKGVIDLRDESDRQGIRIVLDLQRNAKPQAILNNLFKKTALETSFPANFVALVDGMPQTLRLKQILSLYVEHRQEIITRRIIFNLKKAKARAHILEGLKIALDNLDAVIETIKKSKNTEIARQNLMKNFGLSAIQADAILEMQLKRLSQLERQKIEEEYKQIMKEIDHLINLLTHPQKILIIIEKELNSLIENYGDKRRTQVFAHLPGEFSEKDLVPNEPTIITITKENYIKRVSRESYKSQRRGGQGVTGMTTKEEDQIKRLITAHTHKQILFFTDQGRVFSCRVFDIPESNRQAKGKAIVNLIDIDPDEKVEATLILNDTAKEKQYLVLATKKGNIKKTKLSQFAKIRTNGLIAIKLKKDDQLCWAKIVKIQDDILLATAQGQSIRFHQSEIRPTARDTMGVAGIRLTKNDQVIGMIVFPHQAPQPQDKRKKFFRRLLMVTKNGLGKQTDIKAFPVQHRNGRGVKLAKINPKTGPVVAAKLVNQNNKMLIITSKKAHIIKLPLRNIPVLGRNTQGVILMRFATTNDSVTSITALQKSTKE
ncbi:DNA gyrase subunit A [Candidatus Shapirobacteria bacterium CG09_land_8_20_14_0_10_38_17]|uniref:DNA gyrase subunit A n=1 Tax=Candidatus Shapirobacteria bacterium CG09_land_8_20_14_0_10_38_17 TaxID=1974884 RepID=A0A2H0WR74_9BACT|nr:MAG: DNA gyrase subunit A [Candidatus Shapirobacteria bacterium CG09_land_8_20_14_0_10_38_17]